MRPRIRGCKHECSCRYGWGVLDWAFHRITDTHVAHHLFHIMPFYYGAEATRAIIPVLGEYYLCVARGVRRGVRGVRSGACGVHSGARVCECVCVCGGGGGAAARVWGSREPSEC